MGEPTREGPFWEAVAGMVRLPPAAELLGWKLEAVNADAGTVEVSFEARDAFLNPMGAVQGGFLAAMLDETLGPALVATLPPGEFAPTIDLHVQFFRSARPGKITGRGRVTRKGKDIAFMAGELADETGVVVAAATAVAKIQRGRL